MIEKIVVTMRDNVYLHIECDTDQRYELREHFSCYAPNYKYHPKFKNKMWNGKIYFYDMRESILPVGFLHEIREFAKKFKYEVEYNIRRSVLQNDIQPEDLEPFFHALFDGLDKKPRDYQKEAIYQAIKNKRGIIESCTGSGKSQIIYSIIRYIVEDTKKNILLIVPSVSLVTQMYSDMDEYGWDDIQKYVTMLYGNAKAYDPKKKITISTWQSIYKKPQTFFKQFGAVFVDETHLASGASIKSILSKCMNATYRIGLTGTMPEERANQLSIYGYLGKRIYQLRSDTLIEQGFLTDIRIINYHLRYPEDDIQKMYGATYPDEVKFIVKHPHRNKLLKNILSDKHVKDDHNILVLAQRIEHIDNAVKYLEINYPNRKILKIDGATNAESREDIRKYIDTHDGVILVGTYGCMSTGVNIPKLHHVVLFSSFKSKIKVLQSIGRGLRLHKSKSVVFIWDIVDDLRKKKKKVTNTATSDFVPNYGYQHFLKRLEFYKEQNFKHIDRIVYLKDIL